MVEADGLQGRAPVQANETRLKPTGSYFLSSVVVVGVVVVEEVVVEFVLFDELPSCSDYLKLRMPSPIPLPRSPNFFGP